MAQRKQYARPLKTAKRVSKAKATKTSVKKAKKAKKKTPNVLRSQWAEPSVEEQFFSPDFGGALAALKAGYRVARDGWNGAGQYAFVVPAKVWKLDKLTNAQKRLIGKKQLPLLMLKNSQGQVVQWAPSAGDLLADDWYVI